MQELIFEGDEEEASEPSLQRWFQKLRRHISLLGHCVWNQRTGVDGHGYKSFGVVVALTRHIFWLGFPLLLEALKHYDTKPRKLFNCS